MATIKETVKKAARAVSAVVSAPPSPSPAPRLESVGPFACSRTLRLPGEAAPKMDDLRREHVAHYGSSGRPAGAGFTRVEITPAAWAAMGANPAAFQGLMPPAAVSTEHLADDVVAVIEHFQFAVPT